jgi:hypothetical protein
VTTPGGRDQTGDAVLGLGWLLDDLVGWLVTTGYPWPVMAILSVASCEVGRWLVGER